MRAWVPAAGPGPLGPGPGPGPCAKEPLGHVFSQEKYGNHINIYYLAIIWRCIYLEAYLNMLFDHFTISLSLSIYIYNYLYKFINFICVSKSCILPYILGAG